MFDIVEIKKYDTYQKYGIDWHIDYICITDECIKDIDKLIEKIRELGYKPTGICQKVNYEDYTILKTTMC